MHECCVAVLGSLNRTCDGEAEVDVVVLPRMLVRLGDAAVWYCVQATFEVTRALPAQTRNEWGVASAPNWFGFALLV